MRVNRTLTDHLIGAGMVMPLLAQHQISSPDPHELTEQAFRRASHRIRAAAGCAARKLSDKSPALTSVE